MLRESRGDINPDAAAALYAKLQPIMDLLRSARSADYTDWGTGSMKPTSDISVRIGMESDLATMALWESDYRFQADAPGAVSDLDALEAMGRDNVDSTIGLLIQDRTHSSIVSMLAQNIGSLGSASSSDLSDLLGDAPILQIFQAGMNEETALAQAAMDEYNNPATRSNSFFQKTGVTPPTNAEVQSLTQTEQALAGTLQEPDAQFQQWWAQQQAQESSSNTVVSEALAALPVIRAKTQASLVQNAMVQAAVAFNQNGQSGLQSILDPITGQPFTYMQTATGFQLGSTMQVSGKPVTMTFANPPAK